MKLSHTSRYVTKASRELSALAESKTIDEAEERWLDLLNTIDKLWKKANNEVKVLLGSEFSKHKFDSWKAKTVNLRKTDSLLQYVRNARNADEHTIQKLTQKGWAITVDKKMTTDGQWAGTMTLKLELIPFVNEGIRYDLPIKHLDQVITSPEDPQEVGHLAIKFYQTYIQTIEDHFSKKEK